jgi:hypothetical protein
VGNILRCLRFESSDWERDFLHEAWNSFYIPLMEKELMKTGATNILRCVEDLSLKVHVAARCASRLLENEGSSCSRLSTMLEIIAALEKEKIEL